VLNTRILWTFSAAARRIDPRYRETADWAWDYVLSKFWDRQHGGIYWMLDHTGNPISDRKQIYAQAFAAYALAEHHLATGSSESLDRAMQLFHLIEEHSRDRICCGYLEARARDWSPLDDMRLSDKDLNSPKSMNTHLHVMEGYTNLLRACPDAELRAAQRDLLNVTMDRIVDGAAGHFKLFFDMQWNSLSGHVSYGHDIEGSWLLVEAAEVLGDPKLLVRARELALRMASAVYHQALDTDGSLFYEADAQGSLVDPKKHWWAQAEAVVGFYNAWQLSGDERFRNQAYRIWEYIEERVVDKNHGEWHAKLSPDGRPYTPAEDPDACLAGPWKCPYHNSRVCYEILARLGLE
jgi:mannobiose 2-epimerase